MVYDLQTLTAIATSEYCPLPSTYYPDVDRAPTEPRTNLKRWAPSPILSTSTQLFKSLQSLLLTGEAVPAMSQQHDASNGRGRFTSRTWPAPEFSFTERTIGHTLGHTCVGSDMCGRKLSSAMYATSMKYFASRPAPRSPPESQHYFEHVILYEDDLTPEQVPYPELLRVKDVTREDWRIFLRHLLLWCTNPVDQRLVQETQNPQARIHIPREEREGFYRNTIEHWNAGFFYHRFVMIDYRTPDMRRYSDPRAPIPESSMLLGSAYSPSARSLSPLLPEDSETSTGLRSWSDVPAPLEDNNPWDESTTACASPVIWNNTQGMWDIPSLPRPRRSRSISPMCPGSPRSPYPSQPAPLHRSDAATTACVSPVIWNNTQTMWDIPSLPRPRRSRPISPMCPGSPRSPYPSQPPPLHRSDADTADDLVCYNIPAIGTWARPAGGGGVSPQDRGRSKSYSANLLPTVAFDESAREAALEKTFLEKKEAIDLRWEYPDDDDYVLVSGRSGECSSPPPLVLGYPLSASRRQSCGTTASSSARRSSSAFDRDWMVL